MNSYIILLYGFLGAFIAQIMNYVSSAYGKKYYLFVFIFMIISQFLIGFLLLKYYSEGIKFFKFTILALFYYGSGIVFSIFIQKFLLKQNFHLNEIISIFLISTGIIVYLIGKK